MKGWIIVHRKIRDNSFWKCESFSKGQAWIDILLKVNHQERSVVVGSTSFELKPGETIWSLKKMAAEWKWSISKVGRFLDVLESESMLVQKRESKYTKLTVVNWKAYQQNENETKTKRKRNEHQTKTNNNVNNENNENNKDSNVEVQKNIRLVYDYFIEKFEKNPNQVKLTSQRKLKIKARLKDTGLHQVKKAIDNTAASSFHRGDNDRGWQANLDFVIRSQEKTEELAMMQPKQTKKEEVYISKGAWA